MTADHSEAVVAQWREQRPDLDPMPMATFTRLWRAARLADERLQEVFDDHGLERGSFDVLATLRRAGTPFRLSAGALARGLVMTSGGMTKRLDKLEGAGLGARSPHPADRRGVLVSLTERGLGVVDRAVEDHLANEARLLEGLSDRERRRRPAAAAAAGGARGAGEGERPGPAV